MNQKTKEPMIQRTGEVEDKESEERQDKINKGYRGKELRDLYSPPSIIRIIKSRRMRWAGHVARMGRRRTHIGYWWKSQRERDH
jgi:hypothetical protein